MEPPHTPVAPTHTAATDRPPATAFRRIAALMLVEAASLTIASGLHLSGRVSGRGFPYDADHAGIAEALIATVLTASAITMLRVPRHARPIGLFANALATGGFLWGLNITARGGHWPDIAYHLAVLPLLIGSLIALRRPTAR